jgi:catechol 2,3-dioxygenase-like lactoylglutathione lyase family enzyme
MHIDHINIRAPSALLEQVRDFYCTVLGLEEGYRPAFPSTGYWLYAADKPIVHLSLGAETVPAGQRTCLDHVAFQAAGLEAFRARLDALGIEYRSSYIPELHMSQLFFRDPAGTGLEVNFPREKQR